ncbi:hypothetical protein Poli38472_002609 [Pythium oligandrum]|uniref:Multidrug and toxic compound extrusion protein n=1 Tax=Pythium oligandrum TaxID=41045 RepID=A0A8K1CJP8_PYTOL|nr:hypothetical protein Poli38472_002609 [Pythium oligandrum]|eukprot:TMW63668.1 hypothetical protein Poli38472_002609 [Pythium oligandrum]
MEIPRVAHDTLLHGLDEPLDQQLQQAVHDIGHGARIAEDDVRVTIDDVNYKSTEKTPLLMAGKRVVTVDSDLDLMALAMKLTEEEHQAVLEDARTSATDIVQDELKRIFAMCGPLVLAILMEQLPDTITMMMIGKSDPERSTELLAAMGLSGLFQMLLINGIVNGIGSALDTVCSQAFGGKRYAEMWLVIQAGVLMFTPTLIVVSVLYLNGDTILRAMGQDPALAETAWTFLFLSTLSLPLMMIYAIQRSMLQAQNITSPVAVSSAISYVLSIPAAYVLGFWTPLGYVGVAASTIINYVVKVLAIMPAIRNNAVFRETWPGWKLKEAAQLLFKLSRLGLSSILMATFQILGFTVVSVLVGYLPNPAVAITANSILIQSAAFAMTPMMALCISGAVRMGNALGAGQARRASLVSYTIIVLCISTAFVGMIIMMSAAGPITRTFTTDPETVEATTTLFLQAGIVIPAIGASYGVQSIFRACGEQWLCAKLNFVFILVIGAPLGLYFATELDSGITGLWMGNCVGFLGLAASAGVWAYRMSWEEMAHNARVNTHLHVEVTPSCAEAA